MSSARIVTVGHSNRTSQEFVELLLAHRVRRLVDVRTIPKSRAVPWFAERRLRRALEKAGIAYVRIPELGGLRRNSPDPSPRPCWKNRGFRNYADHMRTAEFRQGIRALLAEARLGRTAVMCAEAVPWRCHRSLMADYLVVVQKKRAVDELVGDRARPHRLSVCARVVRGSSYCNDNVICSPNRTATNPGYPEEYFLTSLTPDLQINWRWRNTNTLSCSRTNTGSLSCVSDHPVGFEWCVNAPAVDANCTVFANSEDGNLYVVDRNGNLVSKTFTNLAVGAAYTPLSIGPDGRIYTQNNGHLFVVGN